MPVASSSFARLRTEAHGPEPARHPPRRLGDPWLFSSYERTKASAATTTAFIVAFFAIVLTGAGTLISVPTADTRLLDLPDRLGDPDSATHCLRVARRADYTVVFVGLGAPAQHLQLLLRLGDAVDDADEATPAMWLFSERMHKSLTMTCEPFDPSQDYTEHCQDVVLVFNGTDDQVYAHTHFAYRNRAVAEYFGDRAELLRLDGSLRLVRGRTYWLTSTHLCWEARDPLAALSIADAMPFAYDGATGSATVELADLKAFAPLASVPAARARGAGDGDPLSPDPTVELFPEEASEETEHWLALTTTFLYEYGYRILDTRRAVVEVGSACAADFVDLARANDVYRMDCIVHSPSVCRDAPSVPFRRVAQSRLRIEIASDGAATLRAERTRALSAIPHLLSYSDGLWQALGRLLVMILTAAVVFVRGNQNASSNRYMLERALGTVRCRSATKVEYKLEHTKTEVAIDGLITLTALGSRIVVLAVNWNDFIADGVPHVLVFETIGVVASTVHMLMRVFALELDLKRESPLTKLAGPMSICDVSSAVLMVFADPPLLSTHDGRFAAVGRMLIAILIAISVFSRCIFAVAICALVASCVRNNDEVYSQLKGYQSVLVAAGLLWLLQGAACCATLCILFVQPAAYAMVRMQTGDIGPVRFCIFFGLVGAALPTITKVALRVLESECEAEPSRKAR
jgi:hypothetical protein